VSCIFVAVFSKRFYIACEVLVSYVGFLVHVFFCSMFQCKRNRKVCDGCMMISILFQFGIYFLKICCMTLKPDDEGGINNSSTGFLSKEKSRFLDKVL